MARPVFADLAEEPVLDGIPHGASWRVMTNGDREPESIAQLCLEVIFPSPVATVIAAATVGENKQLVSIGISAAALILPPAPQGIHRKRGGIVR